MAVMKTVVVVSDIHRASAAEQARRGYEARTIPNPFQQLVDFANKTIQVKRLEEEVVQKVDFGYNTILVKRLEEEVVE